MARKANKLIGRNGAFWERDYLDALIEDEAHLQTAKRYIENNPVKAGMIRDPKNWAWSSARFRDELGFLKYPTVLNAPAPAAVDKGENVR